MRERLKQVALGSLGHLGVVRVMTDPGPVVLTVKEVAELLRIHRPKVYELIREQAIEGFKLGADWRVKRDSVEKLIGRIPEEFFVKNGKSKKSA